MVQPFRAKRWRSISTARATNVVEARSATGSTSSKPEPFSLTLLVETGKIDRIEVVVTEKNGGYLVMLAVVR